MTEQELRALVRGVIAQQTIQPTTARIVGDPGPVAPVPVAFLRGHASHQQFALPAAGEHCVIEPAVTCNHCGYCKSYGH